MNKITITTGQLTLKNGALTLKTRETIATRDPALAKPPEKSKAKTGAERQKELYERRKADGWRKVWVNPDTLELADMLGGIEKIPPDRLEWIARVSELEKRDPWWRRFFWRVARSRVC
jgi:hypothetical protein